MKIVITGGGGFLGLGRARAGVGAGTLAGRGGREDGIEKLVLFDAEVPADRPAGLDANGFDGRVEMAAGDIADRDRVSQLIDRDDVAVFHLASVVSAGGERDFDGALRVNLTGGLNVLDALRARTGGPGTRPRLVFASSLAVFGGEGMPAAVGDMTRETPETTYGMTKAVGELMVNDYTRKGFIDGRSARLPTVIIRPGPPNAAASGFASALFREPLAGKEYTLPVGRDTEIMVLGYRNAVAGLIGLMEAPADALGHDRAVSLPNAAYSVEAMIAALGRVAGGKGIALGAIADEPDAATETIVQSWPRRMDDARARALGLPADEGLERVIEDYMEDFGA
ncbi:MAG: NAD-dependent epimerase/dehydratase family protein [Rhodospirillales bacterium]